MLKIIIFFFVFLGIYFQSFASTTTLSSKTPLYGSGTYVFGTDNIHVEKIVFPKTGSGVWINAQDLYNDGNAKVQGLFWIQSLSDTSDKTLWWVTFDHGVSGSETHLVQSGSTQ